MGGFKDWMHKRVSNIYHNRASYIMLIPYTLFFSVFILIPVFMSIGLSFTSFDLIRTPSFVGIANYIRLFLDDEVFTIALTNTLLFAIIIGPAGYLLSFILAWLISEIGPKIRWIPTMMFYAPALAGNGAIIWKFIFDNDSYGLINGFLLKWGLASDPIMWLTDARYAKIVVIIVALWMGMGTGFLTFVAGLVSMNRDLFEAASIDGIKNRWQELWHITLPQLKPQLLLGAVFTIGSAFAIGQETVLLTGAISTDYTTHTIILHMLDVANTRFEYGYASVIQMALLALMLGAWYTTNRFLSKWESY